MQKPSGFEEIILKTQVHKEKIQRKPGMLDR